MMKEFAEDERREQQLYLINNAIFFICKTHLQFFTMYLYFFQDRKPNKVNKNPPGTQH